MITTQKELVDLYKDTFEHRLRSRPIRQEYSNIFDMKMELCKKRIQLVQANKSKTWTADKLMTILGKLKNKKSRDPHGIINELFKPEFIGSDLFMSLFHLLSQVKSQLIIPDFMKYANIQTVPKARSKDKYDLSNKRGIFIVNVFRSILMKLVYDDEYSTIEDNMSDSNIGARKEKSVQNHIFILNGVINEVIRTKNKAVDIQILDYSQCYDTLSLEECINDLYDVGVKNDNLALIYKANEQNKISVQTPFGITERFNIDKTVMQGEVMSPILCSVQVDTIGKQCFTSQKYCQTQTQL